MSTRKPFGVGLPLVGRPRISLEKRPVDKRLPYIRLCMVGFGLATLNITSAQPRSEHKVIVPGDVVVSWLETDIPRGALRARLWESLPHQAAIPKFEVLPNLGWRDRFRQHAEILVSRAKAAVLEGDQLQRALQLILDQEEKAVVPIAAYQATTSNEPVWIVHLQWAQKMTAKFKVAKAGPVLDEKTVEGLGHIRTYAVAFDSLEIVGFTTCH